MTSQIVVLNKKRSFALSESTLILDGFKSYDGEEKIFKISDKLSAVILVSGNGRLDKQKFKNYVSEYLIKTDINYLRSVDDIKTSLNMFIAKSSKKMTVDEYIGNTFPNFERKVKSFTNEVKLKEFLKFNSLNEDIKVLENNTLLNNLLLKLVNFLSIGYFMDKNNLKFYLKRCYYNYLIKISTNLVIVGYDEENENPSYIKYAILFNNEGDLEIMEEYSVYDYHGTIIFTIAQDEDINLNLTGFNRKSIHKIRNSVSELLNQFNIEENVIKDINGKLETKINEIKLDNLSLIIEYIEFLPESEIFKLLDILIDLTAIKKKFSSEPHSVGGKKVKVSLSKYCGVKFIE